MASFIIPLTDGTNKLYLISGSLKNPAYEGDIIEEIAERVKHTPFRPDILNLFNVYKEFKENKDFSNNLKKELKNSGITRFSIKAFDFEECKEWQNLFNVSALTKKEQTKDEVDDNADALGDLL